MNDAAFKRHTRHVIYAWLGLLALMLLSLGSAYVPLGAANAGLGVAIAVAKAAIVAGLFMRLARASTLVRVVAAAALATWLLLLGLSGIDYATRPDEPAATQPAPDSPAFSTGKRS